MLKEELTPTRNFLCALLLLPIEKDVIYWKLADTFLAQDDFYKNSTIFSAVTPQVQDHSRLECEVI